MNTSFKIKQPDSSTGEIGYFPGAEAKVTPGIVVGGEGDETHGFSIAVLWLLDIIGSPAPQSSVFANFFRKFSSRSALSGVELYESYSLDSPQDPELMRKLENLTQAILETERPVAESILQSSTDSVLGEISEGLATLRNSVHVHKTRDVLVRDFHTAVLYALAHLGIDSIWGDLPGTFSTLLSFIKAAADNPVFMSIFLHHMRIGSHGFVTSLPSFEPSKAWIEYHESYRPPPGQCSVVIGIPPGDVLVFKSSHVVLSTLLGLEGEELAFLPSSGEFGIAARDILSSIFERESHSSAMDDYEWSFFDETNLSRILLLIGLWRRLGIKHLDTMIIEASEVLNKILSRDKNFGFLIPDDELTADDRQSMATAYLALVPLISPSNRQGATALYDLTCSRLGDLPPQSKILDNDASTTDPSGNQIISQFSSDKAASKRIRRVIAPIPMTRELLLACVHQFPNLTSIVTYQTPQLADISKELHQRFLGTRVSIVIPPSTADESSEIVALIVTKQHQTHGHVFFENMARLAPGARVAFKSDKQLGKCFFSSSPSPSPLFTSPHV